MFHEDWMRALLAQLFVEYPVVLGGNVESSPCFPHPLNCSYLETI